MPVAEPLQVSDRTGVGVVRGQLAAGLGHQIVELVVGQREVRFALAAAIIRTVDRSLEVMCVASRAMMA